MTVSRFQLSEFIDPDSGRLFGGALPFESWTTNAAALHLHGEYLVYRWTEESNRPAADLVVHANARMLDEFLRVADAEPSSVLRFARRYGDWNVCEHGLPYTHPVPAKRRPCGSLKRQHVDTFRGLARIARALLNASASLLTEERPSQEDWRAVVTAFCAWGRIMYGQGPRHFGLKELIALEHPLDQQATIAAMLHAWMEAGGVLPSLVWRRAQGPKIELLAADGAQLFAALGMLVMSAVSRSSGIELCSGCGKAFNPKSKARTGHRRYCGQCRRAGVPSRDAARDYRAKRASREVP